MDTDRLRERVRELDGVVVAVGLTLLMFGSVMVGSGALGVVQSQQAHESAGKAVCDVSPVGVAEAKPVSNSYAYVGTNDGSVLAVNAGNGSTVWEYTTPTSKVTSDITVKSGLVYAAEFDNTVYAIDAENGTKEWSHSTSGITGNQEVTVVGDTAYFGDLDGYLYARNASDGGQRWTYQTTGGVSIRGAINVKDGKAFFSTPENVTAVDADSGSKTWSVNVSGSFPSSPTYRDGSVIVGDYDGNVHSINASTGRVEWSVDMASDGLKASVVEDGVVYIAGGGNVFALRSSNGSEVWNFTVPGVTGGGTPTTANGNVYVGFTNGETFALDKTSGGVIWNNTINAYIRQPMTVYGGSLYVSDNNDGFYSLDSSTGAVVWNKSVSGGTYSGPSVVPEGQNISYDSRVLEESTGHHGGLPPCEGLWVDAREYQAHNLTTDVTVYAYDDVDGWTDVTNSSNVTVDNTTALTYSNGELTSTTDKSVNTIVEVRADYGRFYGTADVVVATETVNNTDILPPMQSATATIGDDNGLVVVLATAISAGIAFFASSLAGVAAFPVIITGAWVAGYVGTHILLGGLLMSIFIGLNVAQVVEFSG